MALHREKSLGLAGRAEIAAGNLIGVDTIAFEQRVRNIVGARDHVSAAHRPLGIGLVSAVGAAVVKSLSFPRPQPAVLFHSGAELYHGGMTRRGGGQLLGVVFYEAYRAAGLFRHVVSRRRQGEIIFGAEGAAHVTRMDRDHFQRHVEVLAQNLAQFENRLIGHPDREAALLIDFNGDRVRFEIALMHQLRAKTIFENFIRLGEATLDIALARAHQGLDVFQSRRLGLRPVIALIVRMEHGRLRHHGLKRIEHCRQLLVFDVDQMNRFLRGIGIDGGHRCDIFADVANPILRQYRHIFEHRADKLGIEISCGDDRLYAGQIFRPADIDIDDTRVSIGTAQHLSPQSTGPIMIGGIAQSAADLFRAFHSRQRSANNFTRHRKPLPGSTRSSFQTFACSRCRIRLHELRIIARSKRAWNIWNCLNVLNAFYFIPGPAPPSGSKLFARAPGLPC